MHGFVDNISIDLNGLEFECACAFIVHIIFHRPVYNAFRIKPLELLRTINCKI